MSRCALATIALIIALLTAQQQQQGVAAMSVVYNASLAEGIDHIRGVTAITDSTSTSTSTQWMLAVCWSAPGAILKMSATTTSRISELFLNYKQDYLNFIVDGADGRYAYTATYTTPATAVQIDAVTMSQMKAIVLPAEELKAVTGVRVSQTAVVMAMNTRPARLVKFSIGAGNFARVAFLVSSTREDFPWSMVFLPANGANVILTGLNSKPGKVFATSAATLQRSGGLTLNYGEVGLSAAFPDAIDSTIAYFASYTSPARIIKVRASSATLLERLTATRLSYTFEKRVRAGFMLPDGRAYLACATWPGILVRLDLKPTVPVELGHIMAPKGDRYFSSFAYSQSANSSQMVVSTDSGAASVLTYNFNIENFTTTSTYNGGEALVSSIVRSGDFIFCASDTRPAIVTKLHGKSLTQAGSLRLPLGVDWPRAIFIDKFGHGYLGTCTSPGGQIARFNANTMAFSGDILTFEDPVKKDECTHSAMLDPSQETATAQYAWFVQYYGGIAYLLKITAGGMSLLKNVSYPQHVFTRQCLWNTTRTSGSARQFYMIAGTYHSSVVASQVVRFHMRTGTYDTLTLPSGEHALRDGMVVVSSPSDDTGGPSFSYWCSSSASAGIVKVQLSWPSMQRVGKTVIRDATSGAAIQFYSAIDLGDGFGLFGTRATFAYEKSAKTIYKLDLASMAVVDTLAGGVPGVLEAGLGESKDRAFMASYTSPSYILRLDTSTAPSSGGGAAADFKKVSMAAVAGGIAGGVAVLCAVAAVCFLTGRKTAKPSNSDEPMLQVPTQTTTTFVHSAMSVPDRSAVAGTDMYSNRVAVPPARGSYQPQGIPDF